MTDRTYTANIVNGSARSCQRLVSANTKRSIAVHMTVVVSHSQLRFASNISHGGNGAPSNFTVKLAAPGFGPGLKPLGQS